MDEKKKKLVFGVGLCDNGRHQASNGTKATPGYKLWQRMLQRCYDPKFLSRRPTYVGCEAHNEFLSFQKFMDWASVQVGYGKEDWALDKDLLVRGNKVYGPDTCVFLPRKLNQVINLLAGKRNGVLPLGVFLDKRNGSYYSSLRLGHDNKHTRLGTFNSVEEAFNAYKKAKEGKIRRLAEEFKNQIDARAYNSLIAYEVHIDD